MRIPPRPDNAPSAEEDPLNLWVLEFEAIRDWMTTYIIGGLPSQSLRDGKLCAGCLASTAKLYSCGQCKNKSRLYCSRKCQQKDWSFHKQMCKTGQPKLQAAVGLWMEQYGEILTISQQLSGMPHLIAIIAPRRLGRSPGAPFRVLEIALHDTKTFASKLDGGIGKMKDKQTASVRCHVGEDLIGIHIPLENDIRSKLQIPTLDELRYWEPALRILSTLDLPNLNRRQLDAVWRVIERKLRRLADEKGSAHVTKMDHYRQLKPPGWPDLLTSEVYLDGNPSEELVQQSRDLVGRWFRDEMKVRAKEHNITFDRIIDIATMAATTVKSYNMQTVPL